MFDFLQKLQKEIESQSSVIRAVEKLCDRLQPLLPQEEERNFRDIVSSLEKRWHEVWLASLEWQFRLEDALSPSSRHPVFPFEVIKKYFLENLIEKVYQTHICRFYISTSLY